MGTNNQPEPRVCSTCFFEALGICTHWLHFGDPASHACHHWMTRIDELDEDDPTPPQGDGQIAISE